MINRLMMWAARVWNDEDGIGTIEVVLLIVVLVGLVIIFKKQIVSLLTSIFSSINNSADKIY